MWSVHLTNISLTLSIWASKYRLNWYLSQDSLYTLVTLADFGALANMSNAATLPVSIVVTVCSYFFQLPYFWFNVGWTGWQLYYQIYQIAIHTLPLIFEVVDVFILSDTILYAQDVWMTIFVIAAYLGMTFVYTRYTGHVIYSFLTWDGTDYYSSIFAIVVSLAGIILEMFCALITQM